MSSNLLLVFQIFIRWCIVAGSYMFLSFTGLLIVLYICRKYIKVNIDKLEVE